MNIKITVQVPTINQTFTYTTDEFIRLSLNGRNSLGGHVYTFKQRVNNVIKIIEFAIHKEIDKM